VICLVLDRDLAQSRSAKRWSAKLKGRRTAFHGETGNGAVALQVEQRTGKWYYIKHQRQ
jgi:hypothetical protein